jgi:hypothetical protein
MIRAKIVFSKMVQDKPEWGSNDKVIVSRVFFNLDVEGKVYENLYSIIKLGVGAEHECDSLEVSPPVGYNGPFNYPEFRSIVETYYRFLVERTGRMAGVPSRLRLYGNTYDAPLTVPLNIEEGAKI